MNPTRDAVLSAQAVTQVDPARAGFALFAGEFVVDAFIRTQPKSAVP